ncbi:hypothetical protein EYF80_021119 [Liparis tanakae]|uniref:Uncharacterized protein n=1 Tax=Liparis tanakae TaxID=230148 RepID=A0A4Z2HTF9_9TELE|nr:hypothetical protein EYF80_021119 [Liparis tanakae]
MPATKRLCFSSSGLNLTQYGTFLLVKREIHWPVEEGTMKVTLVWSIYRAQVDTHILWDVKRDPGEERALTGYLRNRPV